MKKLSILLLAIGLGANSFAQNVDWVNAPLNPIPDAADLKYQNLKGDVYQNGYSHYTAEGAWYAYDHKEKRTQDAKGRVLSYTNSYGSATNYSYDSRGNLVKAVYQSGNYSFSYEYDNKNRLIKEEYRNGKNETRNNRYSYAQKGDLLVVSEKSVSIKGDQSEAERHFKKGIEVFSKTKGYPGIVFQYQMDNKGNWHTKAEIDADTKRPRKNYAGQVVAPYSRAVIYHDEYTNRQRNLTVVLKDLFKGEQAQPLLAPEVFINGKQWKRVVFSRFGNDYIFYDPLSISYYIARDAYRKDHNVGDKILVEPFQSGSEAILLNSSKGIQLCTSGKALKDKTDWVYIYEDAFYAVANKKEGIYYFFTKPSSPITSLKTASIPAINNVPNGNSGSNIYYYVSREDKSLIIYQDNKIISQPLTVAGFILGTKDVVMAENGSPKYVLSNYGSVVDKQITRGRHFLPNKDKLQALSNSKK